MYIYIIYVFENKILRRIIYLTGPPTGKRSLGRSRSRWKDNIRMELKEICMNTRNWVDSVQDRDYWRILVNTAMRLRVP